MKRNSVGLLKALAEFMPTLIQLICINWFSVVFFFNLTETFVKLLLSNEIKIKLKMSLVN